MIRIVIYFSVILFALTSCRRKPDITRVQNEEGENMITIIGSPSTDEELSSNGTLDSGTVSERLVSGNSFEIPRILNNLPSQILKREGYSISYNNATKNANWVAWHLTAEHTDGSWKRNGIPYMVDEEVKGARQELEDWDDLDMELDHGHMCPAGDNKWSREAMEQTFLLTNMCPQNSALNRGDWEKLESRCRGWAKHYGEIYIACGPIFYNLDYKTIGDNKVGVPDAFFKVVLRMGKMPAALGFIYPNDGTHHPMDYYVLRVDEVEEKTGIDFFYNLPDDIEDNIESHSELKKW